MSLGNEGVKELRDFTNLRTLYLHNSVITGDALKDLRNLKDLQTLNLGGNHGIGDALSYLDLKEFRNLENLDLSYTAITDASLAELRVLPKLRRLTIGTSYHPDTPEITDKGLKELKGIASLQTLNLRYTGTTKTGWDDLQAALPKLKIIDFQLDAEVQPKETAKRKVLLPKDTRPDVLFVFDFDQLNFNSGFPKRDAELKARCDAFVKTQRDEVYPVLREITGVPLGKYYKEIRYTIVPAGQVGGTAGGTASRGIVRLDLRYSVSSHPPHDIHEMIHVFNEGSGALRSNTDHLYLQR
jgi:hypothetical protein